MKKYFTALILTISIYNTANNYWKDLLLDNIYIIKECSEGIGDELTYSNVYKYLLCKEVSFPKKVHAQIMLETGHLSSTVCLKYNNLFGWHNGKRYLRFNSWKESIDFAKEWQIKRNVDMYDDYFDFIDGNNYHTSDKQQYKSKCLSILNKVDFDALLDI